MANGLFSRSSVLGGIVDVCALLCIFMLWNPENTVLTVVFVIWGLVVAVDLVLTVYRLARRRRK
ncbi:MAG TPA: hypothetical protein H9752_01520 [Candidatus Phocaeicola excrementigallinarum]|nr:hypothetical protein [Candidatus Phocaeicola excrementigallinarum]